MDLEQSKTTVGQFMTEQPLTVDRGLSLGDALDRMNANNVRHLLVVDGDRLCGVVSNRDLSFAAGLQGVDTRKTHVDVAMRDHVYVCDEHASLEDVAHDMEAHRYGCAAVLRQGFVVGIFTTTDALRALRQVLHGGPVEAAVHPTHRVQQPEAREKVPHTVRVSDALRRASNLASPTESMLGIRRV